MPRWPSGTDELDQEIYRIVAEGGPLTLSEISRSVGRGKAVVFRHLRRLRSLGVLELREVGGVLLASLPPSPSRVVAVGMMRAAEYPYILELLRGLRDMYGHVRLVVYDDAWRAAEDLTAGRIQLAMLPVLTALAANRLGRGRVQIIGGGSGGGMGVVRGASGAGHMVIRVSNTELCAERAGLEGPRRYAGSAGEVLSAVMSGSAGAGVLWEPYLSIAASSGLRAEPCELSQCCLLSANSGVSGDYGRISRLASEAISRARSVDLQAYARLVELPAHLVESSLRSYTFHEEPDVGYLERLLEAARRSLLPEGSAREAVVA
ncbi:MAG: winged helix-turn-helix transcriptional regulator [Thaumarchaeota archaeon]|nr:winged helix-turn-helix transcriptional regulator [Nitrososphaerota archaeon]